MSRFALARLLGLLFFLGITLPAAADDYTRTRYPIVLVHGILSSSQVAGFSTFFNIPEQLGAGGATVYAVDVAVANSDEVRGENLITELEHLQALHGHAKFNLYGHSQGGFTARYVASVRPDLVASVTTFSTPHTGSRLADLVGAVLPEGSPLRPLVATIVNAFATFNEWAAGNNNPTDILAALNQLNSAGAAAFNQHYPQGRPDTACGQGANPVNGIYYYSFGGTATSTNLLDPSDALLTVTSLAFGSEPSDGITGKCSSHWGTVVRDNHLWNHLDATNQIFGLRSLFSADPAEVARTQANRLKNLGL